MTATDQPSEGKSRATYLTVSQQYNLNIVCRAISPLFTFGTYHVGSSITRPDWRDVDLRCILEDGEYDRMFEGETGEKQRLFLNVAISEWIAARTGLPIDFQFQRQTNANAEFDGPRSYVGHG